MKKQSSLQPVGFYDLIFDEAEKNHKNINSAIDGFLKAGYRLIKTPLAEFEDSFTPESDNYFQAVDVISGKNLVFRNDITPQISRLLSSRLREENLPLKICYSGDVLCAKSDELYKDRQQTQVGLEIIGCNAEKSNFEIIENLLTTLKKLLDKNQKKDLVIEFSLPNFLEIFFSELKIENKEELRAAIIQKNISQVRDLSGKDSDIINKIMLTNNDLKGLVKEISVKIKSQKVIDEMKKAQKISNFLANNFPEVRVCFDLFGDRNSTYHNEIIFDVFCGDFSYPIARGGRYKTSNIDAIGATIYINRLRKIA